MASVTLESNEKVFRRENWGPTGVDFKTFLREGDVGMKVEKLIKFLDRS
jgi:hypothetical protein